MLCEACACDHCMQAATNRVPSPVAVLLWQLVAASAHIIVPVAIYNLKVCGLLRSTTGSSARFSNCTQSVAGSACIGFCLSMDVLSGLRFSGCMMHTVIFLILGANSRLRGVPRRRWV